MQVESAVQQNSLNEDSGFRQQPLETERVTNATLLGLNITVDLKWNNHFDQITTKTDLSYNEACQKANLPKLSERRDILSQNLFTYIVRNESHKLQ